MAPPVLLRLHQVLAAKAARVVVARLDVDKTRMRLLPRVVTVVVVPTARRARSK